MKSHGSRAMITARSEASEQSATESLSTDQQSCDLGSIETTPRQSRASQPAIFTIVSRNYISYAATLMQTAAAHHPEAACYIFLVDRPCDFSDLDLPAQIVVCEDLGIREFERMALRYQIMELNTAVKPFCIQWLFRTPRHDKVIYLDPDIFVLRQLTAVWDLLRGGAPLVLTPHITSPLQDGFHPSDINFLQGGVYNLGFAAFARAEATEAFVDWWSQRLVRHCRVDLPNHLFVDQRWMDLAPCFVPNTAILRHPGYNAAYWNLAHRPVTWDRDGWYAGGQPLHFFHFSGIDPLKPDKFSKHQDRFSLDSVGGLRPLVETYVQRLLANKYSKYIGTPYAYAIFSDGRPIHPLMRRYFRRVEDEGITMAGVSIGRGSHIFDRAEPTLSQPELPEITRIVYQLWLERDDLRDAFALDTAEGRFGLLRWFVGYAQAEEQVDEQSLSAAATLLDAVSVS